MTMFSRVAVLSDLLGLVWLTEAYQFVRELITSTLIWFDCIQIDIMYISVVFVITKLCSLRLFTRFTLLFFFIVRFFFCSHSLTRTRFLCHSISTSQPIASLFRLRCVINNGVENLICSNRSSIDLTVYFAYFVCLEHTQIIYIRLGLRSQQLQIGWSLYRELIWRWMGANSFKSMSVLAWFLRISVNSVTTNSEWSNKPWYFDAFAIKKNPLNIDKLHSQQLFALHFFPIDFFFHFFNKNSQQISKIGAMYFPRPD